MTLKQEFEDYYDAEDAVEEMNDKKVEGRRLTVEPAGKKKRYRERSRSSHRRHRKRYTYVIIQKPQLFRQSIEIRLQ
jgi:RNA recognition motif-containing protein